MSASTYTNNNHSFVVQSALSAYSDEAYTNARTIVNTGIVSGNSQIDKNTETYVGQLRWRRPINPVINVGSATDATDGDLTTTSSGLLSYVKTIRTLGMNEVNVDSILTQEGALAKLARDFVQLRTQDESNALISVIKGVCHAEAKAGTGTGGLGGQTFSNDPTNAKYGFYVDLGTSKLVGAASASAQGAQRAEGFLNAIGMAWKDYELPYYYLLTNPETLASLRSANLIDEDRITDGDIEFQTLFQGKFRLILTRGVKGLSTTELTALNAGAGVDIVGKKTTVIIAPGAIARENLTVPLPFEVERKASSYHGTGDTTVWHRWGYILHPAGYNWAGATNAFPADSAYEASSAFTRQASSALTLGILPIFHD